MFNPGGGIANDVLKAVGSQFFQNTLYAFDGQRVFVTGLRGGQYIEVFRPLVFNQSLTKIGFTIDDIDEVVHDAAFAVHDDIKVAQTYIKIDNHGFMAAHSDTTTYRGAGGGFTHTAFS